MIIGQSIRWRRPAVTALVLATLWCHSALLCAQQGLADLDATVVYETRELTSAGVERTERWSDRLIRRGNLVWTQRLIALPGQSQQLQHAGGSAQFGHDSHAGAAEPAVAGRHRHFDYERAARLVERNGDGTLRLRFVDPQRQLVVDVPKQEFATVGFDADWSSIAHLVPPVRVLRMPVAGARRADGSRWHTERSGGWTHRVLWSPRLQMATEVESVRDDGSARRTIKLVPRAATAPGRLPWLSLSSYQQLSYDDFLD